MTKVMYSLALLPGFALFLAVEGLVLQAGLTLAAAAGGLSLILTALYRQRQLAAARRAVAVRRRRQ